MSDWITRLKATHSPEGRLLGELAKEFGTRGGAARWLFLSLYSDHGPAMVWRFNYPERTYHRRLSEARRRGWLERMQGRFVR
jgi:hypothetical protein